MLFSVCFFNSLPVCIYHAKNKLFSKNDKVAVVLGTGWRSGFAAMDVTCIVVI